VSKIGLFKHKKSKKISFIIQYTFWITKLFLLCTKRLGQFGQLDLLGNYKSNQTIQGQPAATVHMPMDITQCLFYLNTHI